MRTSAGGASSATRCQSASWCTWPLCLAESLYLAQTAALCRCWSRRAAPGSWAQTCRSRTWGACGLGAISLTVSTCCFRNSAWHPNQSCDCRAIVSLAHCGRYMNRSRYLACSSQLASRLHFKVRNLGIASSAPHPKCKLDFSPCSFLHLWKSMKVEVIDCAFIWVVLFSKFYYKFLPKALLAPTPSAKFILILFSNFSRDVEGDGILAFYRLDERSPRLLTCFLNDETLSMTEYIFLFLSTVLWIGRAWLDWRFWNKIADDKFLFYLQLYILISIQNI